MRVLVALKLVSVRLVACYLVGAALAVAAHVQRCYAVEAQKVAAIPDYNIDDDWQN